MGLNGINSARSRTRPAYHMTTNQQYIKKGSGLVIRGAHSNEIFLEGLSSFLGPTSIIVSACGCGGTLPI